MTKAFGRTLALSGNHNSPPHPLMLSFSDTVKRHAKTLPSRPNEGLFKRGETPPAPDKELPPPPQPQEPRDKGQDVSPARALRTESPPKTPLKGIHDFTYPFFPSLFHPVVLCYSTKLCANEPQHHARWYHCVSREATRMRLVLQDQDTSRIRMNSRLW